MRCQQKRNDEFNGESEVFRQHKKLIMIQFPVSETVEKCSLDSRLLKETLRIEIQRKIHSRYKIFSAGNLFLLKHTFLCEREGLEGKDRKNVLGLVEWFRFPSRFYHLIIELQSYYACEAQKERKKYKYYCSRL